MLRKHLFLIVAILVACSVFAGCLELTPKTSTRFVGAHHQLTARLILPALPPDENEELQSFITTNDIDLDDLITLANNGSPIVWEIVSGPGHFVGAPETIFDENAEARAVITSNVVGTTVIRATANIDPEEFDLEGLDLAVTLDLDQEEPGLSDTAQVVWVVKAVGGEAFSANKLGLLAPWLAVAGAIGAGAATALRRRRVES